MTFKVGDKVQIEHPGPEAYGVTKKGSQGTIVRVSDDVNYVYVEFFKLIGEYDAYDLDHSYPIYKRHLVLLKGSRQSFITKKAMNRPKVKV